MTVTAAADGRPFRVKLAADVTGYTAAMRAAAGPVQRETEGETDG